MRIAPNILIALMAVGTLANSLVYPLIYLEFAVNRSYIATELCEERAQPMSACGGSCYLEDRIEEAANRQQGEEAPVEAKPQLVLFCQEVTAPLPRPASQRLAETDTRLAQNQTMANRHAASGVFRPPIA